MLPHDVIRCHFRVQDLALDIYMQLSTPPVAVISCHFRVQDLALGIYMPPPFDRILKGISCSQVRKIMEDVQA